MRSEWHDGEARLALRVHLLEGDEAPALDLGEALNGGNGGATDPTEIDRMRTEDQIPDLPM